MISNAELYGLVLSGGKSTRMGTDKGLITYHGVPQREYLYEMLGQVCNRTFLSLRQEQMGGLTGTMDVILDENRVRGPFNGLLSAHNAYPQAALIPPWRRLRPLTTPIDYLSALPIDPFTRIDRIGQYRYGAMDLDAASRWVLASIGPDRRRDMDPIEFYPGYQPGLFMGQVPDFNYMIYDPTNGTISIGDVIRASDYVPQ